MESGSKQQMLKRITSLVSENKELKKKYKALSDAYNGALDELERQKGLMEKAKQDEPSAVTKPGPRQVRFDTVTVLFVEIQGFSNIIDSSSSDMAEYMDKLDYLIFQFNEIVKKYKLVKLHSIGDNFICAGGIPEKNITNPVTVTLAAMEMLHIVNVDSQSRNDWVWNLQIGIHTGSVTALTGGRTQAKNYDVSGDTVNVVSRIVSIGVKNTALVSANTYELIKELFDCRYSVSMPVKYRDKLDLFTVEGIKAEFALSGCKYLPNDAFRTQFMLVQFSDLQELVLDKLEKELPDYLYYHNVKHTVDVVTESELIGWAEGLDDYQMLMLKTAALFHDAGHTVSYADHEDRSAEIARNMLPKYRYDAGEIDEICRIIMATKLPPRPSDLLEAIICDSDLDYLGRTDFIPVSNALYEELKAQNKMTSLNDWNKLQLKFIGSHQYFTKTGRRLREVKKQEQIDRIRQLIENQGCPPNASCSTMAHSV
jgi:class 3 adenylate cyclase